MSFWPDGLLFAVRAAVAVFFVRAYLRRPTLTPADTALNSSAEHYLGRRFTLETPIVNGRGSIKVDDSVWRAAGPELPAGRQVKVIGVEGTVLQVEASD